MCCLTTNSRKKAGCPAQTCIFVGCASLLSLQVQKSLEFQTFCKPKQHPCFFLMRTSIFYVHLLVQQTRCGARIFILFLFCTHFFFRIAWNSFNLIATIFSFAPLSGLPKKFLPVERKLLHEAMQGSTFCINQQQLSRIVLLSLLND